MKIGLGGDKSTSIPFPDENRPPLLSSPSIALIVDILMDVALLTVLSQVLAGILDHGLRFGTRLAGRWISARPFGATARPRDGRAYLASSHCDLRIMRAMNAKVIALL
jgi:hypothetical protein